jgi:hypothetical protein
MNKQPILRENDIGLMKISDIIYMVLAKDEKRLGVQLFKTQTLNIQTNGYGETQYALPSFEIALKNFNHRIHIDYHKKMVDVQNEFNSFRRYIREKLRDFIKNDEEGYHSIGDIEELLEDII